VPKLSRSNPLALAVLVSLMEAPMHPYQLAQTLRLRGKEDSVRLNFGSLYAVFEALERRGLVKARETLREGRRPERTVYEVTKEGIREAIDWLAEMLAVRTKEYPQFMAALSFMPALPPEDALLALEHRARQLEVCLVKARSLRRAASDFGLPRLFSIEGEYEEALLEAELAFVQKLAKELNEGSLEGLEGWRGFHAGDEAALQAAKELD
jgi:DNA-binding PadR family transcriptional regulator